MRTWRCQLENRIKKMEITDIITAIGKIHTNWKNCNNDLDGNKYAELYEDEKDDVIK